MYFSTILILLLAVLDILVYYLQKLHEEDNGEKKKSSSSSSLDKRSVREEDHSEIKESSSSSLYNQCQTFSLAEIKLATNDFDDASIIGKGGFGKVYRGKVELGGGIDVAVKRSNLDSSQGATEFRSEIQMLSKVRHSHIVSLLGYCEDEMILVYEYMPNGSLYDHLHKKRANGSNSSPLTWIQRLNICIGAARGLDYLHTGTGVHHRVIHRDVKSSNILLDDNLAGKIADFGLSRITPASQSGSTTNVYTDHIISTFGYMDAEYFSTHRLTRKSDVYAFGVVLLEVLCGRAALDFTLDEKQHSLAGWAKHCIKKGKINQIVDPCLRGEISAKCLTKFGQIAYECLRTCSKDRPTMTMVLARLELVLKLTLQSVSNRKDIGWSLLFTKALRHVVPDRKKGGVSQQQQQQAVRPSGEILKEFTFSELRTATRNFRPDTVLGEGGFGRVFKGWLDRPQKSGDRFPVAIKVLNHESPQGLKEWQAEVNILGKFSHPNLVKLLGYCQKSEKLLLVYEYMQKGSLENHLFRSEYVLQCTPTNTKNVSKLNYYAGFGALPWYTRIKIAIGAAQGLTFLHATENNVIYRDVKSSNILLDEDYNARLSDFGLAKFGPDNGESHVTTCVVGTYGYAAPEYIATGHLYVKSDVYSFGVVLLEIITGLRVLDVNRHSSMHNLVEWARPLLGDKKIFHRLMDSRLEKNYPLKAAHKTAKLVLNCIQPRPEDRPSMEEVVSGLHDINAMQNEAV